MTAHWYPISALPRDGRRIIAANRETDAMRIVRWSASAPIVGHNLADDDGAHYTVDAYTDWCECPAMEKAATSFVEDNLGQRLTP